MFGLRRRVLFPRHLLQNSRRALADFPGVEPMELPIRGGAVEAWFLPGEGVSAARPGPLVLFAHGNGELIDDWPVDLMAYRRRGLSVLLPEYRGYGRSSGHPSQRSIVSDFVRFFDRVTKRDDVDPGKILFHGRSIGGGVVCALAHRRRPSGLVLWSTFTSVADVARRFGLPGFVVPDRFDNLAVVRTLECPLLVVHGRHDRLIPLDHAHALARAHSEAQLLLYDADHNDCPPATSEYWDVFDRWVERSAVFASASR